MAIVDLDQSKKQERQPQIAQSEINVARAVTPAVQRQMARRAAMDIQSASPDAVMQLQRMVGNQVVARMVADSRRGTAAAQTVRVPVQAKLTVGPVGDRYEREADQIASKVMRMTTPVQRDKEEGAVQRMPVIQRSATDNGGFAVDKSWEKRLNSTKGKGAPLPDKTRSLMESRFNADFSNVRVHHDTPSVQMSQEINAQAFTSGSDIYFSKGKFNPGSTGGQKLLAHELTHVIQQGGAVQRRPEIRRCAKCEKDKVLTARTKDV